MGRFIHWWIGMGLKQQGWPRTRGLLKKTRYVDTSSVDAMASVGTLIAVGLGAGRPQLAAAILADTWPYLPWGTEVGDAFVDTIRKDVEKVDKYPNLLPWEALCYESRLGPMNDWIDFDALANSELQGRWGFAVSSGVLWGLTHVSDMPHILERLRTQTQREARQMRAVGVTTTLTTFPPDSLDKFYETCQGCFESFEAHFGQLPPVPAGVRKLPEVTARVKSWKAQRNRRPPG